MKKMIYSSLRQRHPIPGWVTAYVLTSPSNNCDPIERTALHSLSQSELAVDLKPLNGGTFEIASEEAIFFLVSVNTVCYSQLFRLVNFSFRLVQRD